VGGGAVLPGGAEDSLSDSEKEQRTKDRLVMNTEARDLIDYGMIPEFVGRFPVLVPFHSLSTSCLIRILTEPRNAIIPQFKTLFAMDEVSLEFEKEALEDIARLAMERKTGARGLRAIMENLLLDAMFEVPGSDVSRVLVTSQAVKGMAPVTLHRHTLPTVQDEEESQDLPDEPSAATLS